MTKLQVGTAAPDFSAPDQNGQLHTLKQYQGQWVVLYFYPKDDTPGCTTQACGFESALPALRAQAILLGVSSDDVTSHQSFATKFELSFPLLADPDQKIISSYGTNGFIFDKRITFIIDPQGIIATIYEKIDVQTHATTVLNDLKQLIQDRLKTA